MFNLINPFKNLSFFNYFDLKKFMASALVGPTTYEFEPPRHPDMIINSKDPYNAEPTGKDLIQNFITPVDFFYKRNHGPIPILDDPQNYRLVIQGLTPTPISLSLSDIKNLPKETVTATLQCAGNRRTEMSLKKKVKGVGWGLGAIGNATWSGVKLYRVLEMAGVSKNSKFSSANGKHVEFISVDACKEENGGPYKASIPLIQASSPQFDVLLAYEMNGEELNRDHGFPLRVIVPGVIGARSVKWINQINILSHESLGFFMQKDYKMFSPSVDWHNVEWESRRPIMDFPIQSAICEPLDHEIIKPGEKVTIKGYAASGFGRGIERVDISVNGGKDWSEAERLPQGHEANCKSGQIYIADDEFGRDNWSWVFWQFETTLSPPCEIIARAVDSSCNVQPENVFHVWNLRGVLNNSWHRINVFPPGSFLQVSNPKL